VTAGPQSDLLPASQVAELITGLGKALRAFHMYLPNNPIYQRATDNLRAAFSSIWAVLDELVLTWPRRILWEAGGVSQLNRRGVAWGSSGRDALLTIRRGAEEDSCRGS
jgi:hypothetical protein